MMLPNGWKKVKLGDVAKVTSGGTPLRTQTEYWNGDIPWVKTAQIQNRHISKDQVDEYITELGVKESSAKIVPKGTLLMAMYGQGKTRGQVAILDIDATINQACAAFNLKENEVSTQYLFQYFLFNYDNIRNLSNDGGQKNLSAEIIKKIPLDLPPLEEQKKIATTLSVWDSAIEKMEKFIDAKESQKKSLITKLIVFSDDKNISELTKIKLSDIFDEVCEKNRPDEDVLTIIQGVGTVLRTDSGREIIYDKNSLSNYKYVKKGDFIIHLRSFESGLEVANQDGIVSPAYIILRPKIKVSTVYLYSLLHTNEFINRTIAPAVEGARDGRSVKYDVLKNQTITLPNLSEQQSVARLLLKADEELSLLKQQLENYKKQKQGLMQKLLTGQWRVK